MRSMIRGAIGLGALALCACGGESASDEVEAVRTDSAGVEIVTSPGVDRPLEWRLERLFALGGADEGPEMFARVITANVGADTAGRLYVLDYSAHRVVVFGPDGSVLRTMGSEGEGPGELAQPYGMAVSPDGGVSIFDYGRGGLVGFDPDGAADPPMPFGYFPDAYVSRHLARTGERIVVATPFRATRDVLELLSFVPEAADTVVVASVPQPPREMVRYGCVGLRQPRIFEPTLVWATRDDRIVAARSARYAVDLIRPMGTIERSIRREIEPVASTEALALADVGDGMEIGVGGRTCRIGAQEMVDGRGFADIVPTIANVVLGPTGEVWVERRETGVARDPAASRTEPPPAGPIDVFSSDGAYLGTLPEGTPFPLLLLPGDRVAYTERDALDIERLVVARVVRHPPPE